MVEFKGGKWAKISRFLNERTENAVKNRARHILEHHKIIKTQSKVDFSEANLLVETRNLLSMLQKREKNSRKRDVLSIKDLKTSVLTSTPF